VLLASAPGCLHRTRLRRSVRDTSTCCSDKASWRALKGICREECFGPRRWEVCPGRVSRRLATRWQAKPDYAQNFQPRACHSFDSNDIKRDLLSLVEILQSRTFDRADAHEESLPPSSGSINPKIQIIVFCLGGPSAPSHAAPPLK
jgi:hypothetical protein